MKTLNENQISLVSGGLSVEIHLEPIFSGVTPMPRPIEENASFFSWDGESQTLTLTMPSLNSWGNITFEIDL